MVRSLARLIAVCMFLSLPAGAQTLTWETDWDTAFTRAKAERKLVFVDFYASWCEPCRQMESQTLRAPAVVDVLSKFVLLRINVDSSTKDEELRVRKPPWFSIRDPWQRQIAALSTYYEARLFAPRMQRLVDLMPPFIESGEELNRGETADAFMTRANIYDRAGALPDARLSYLKAAEKARKGSDEALAQRALIEAAVALIRNDKAAEGIAELRKLVTAAHDRDLEAAMWFAIGFGEEQRYKTKQALEAYQRAAATATAGSPLLDQINRRLAKLSR